MLAAHAEIRQAGGGFTLSSLPGAAVLLNGRPADRHRLRSGDSITLGGTVLVFSEAGGRFFCFAVLGAYLGLSRIPLNWIENVELAEVALQMADDLLIGYQGSREWRERYPGY